MTAGLVSIHLLDYTSSSIFPFQPLVQLKQFLISFYTHMVYVIDGFLLQIKKIFHSFQDPVYLLYGNTGKVFYSTPKKTQ